jgi:hypothetical protein
MFQRTDIERVATVLHVEPAALAAVINVESSSRAFLSEGNVTPNGVHVGGWPIIRFEAHVFYRELQKIKVNPDPLLAEYSNILSKKRNDKLSKGSIVDYDRLFLARTIQPEAADKSASWGAFQIMGFNHNQAGFQTIGKFTEAMRTLTGQITAFQNLILNDKKLHTALQAKDWTTFARLYNGPGYKQGNYHIKIRNEYDAAVRRGVNENV